MIDWDAAVIGPCMAVFGEAEKITYMPAAGGSFQVDGVFDNAYREITMIDTGPGVSTVRPVLGVRASQFAKEPVQGDKLYIPRVDTTYIVNNPNPDSHGWILLLLNKVK